MNSIICINNNKYKSVECHCSEEHNRTGSRIFGLINFNSFLSFLNLHSKPFFLHVIVTPRSWSELNVNDSIQIHCLIQQRTQRYSTTELQSCFPILNSSFDYGASVTKARLTFNDWFLIKARRCNAVRELLQRAPHTTTLTLSLTPTYYKERRIHIYHVQLVNSHSELRRLSLAGVKADFKFNLWHGAQRRREPALVQPTSL